MAAFFLSYLGLGIANVVMVSLRQGSTPTALLGRMNAAFRTLLFGGGWAVCSAGTWPAPSASTPP